MKVRFYKVIPGPFKDESIRKPGESLVELQFADENELVNSRCPGCNYRSFSIEGSTVRCTKCNEIEGAIIKDESVRP